MNKDNNSVTIYRKDYRPPDYLVDTVRLEFDLGEESTLVRSVLSMRRNNAVAGKPPLRLSGRELKLKSLRLDGAALPDDAYDLDGEGLTLRQIPEAFTLEAVTEIRPQENASLEGLYKSGGIFCTQCEAEGFRKITFYPDRPDVLARFTVAIRAEKAKYPVLLSNGNCVESGDLSDGRHYALWEDPFPKPSYLFALVAGDLVLTEDRFVTRSGREVALRIYTEARNRDKCGHAMASLKKAMRWDEEVYGLEYDLDIYMILAVDDFNMGAMENKGLNIFNSKYVLARPDTATDDDFWAIEEVVAHEYFHNWTGNRVTCRDWFQLSLKEGLTVYRDQEFSADMTSRALKRIRDVRVLRNGQFPEDSGPMAHPVRPDAYEEINNFYTATVYNKGAEVIRMMEQLLGKEGFNKGVRLYLSRHDGQAATCDDFAAAMEEAGGVDLRQFKRWYSQAGTPKIQASGSYDETSGCYTLTLRQSCRPTPGQETKEPFHIPFAVGLVGPDGKDLPLKLAGEVDTQETTRVLSLLGPEETFTFTGIPSRPVPSLNRAFSAPVRLDFDYSDADLAFLMANDGDSFNRWEAGQQLAQRIMLRLIGDLQRGTALSLDGLFIDAFRALLVDRQADSALIAEAMVLPGETHMAEQMETADPGAIRQVREFVRKTLALRLREELLALYRENADDGPYSIEPGAVGRRSLKNGALAYLMTLDDSEVNAICLRQFDAAMNMTDVTAALAAFSHSNAPERATVFDRFFERWKDEPLVIDRWFTLQAISMRKETLREVARLAAHPAFNIRNPNRVRSLLGAFCQGNPVGFHDPSGAGYRLLADHVLLLDGLNHQVAAAMTAPLGRWRRYDAGRQALMKAELTRIGAKKGLSRNVAEIVHKSLA